MKQYYSFLLFLICLSTAGAAQSDTASVYTLDSFLLQVKKHHPVAIQAEMQRNIGEAGLRESRGAFDPVIEASLDQKYFNDQEYYDLGNGRFKIPTWFGVELEAGYERNDGSFINPEDVVPNRGLWFAGVSVPIGKGLFIDERRAELKKAQSVLMQSEAERDIMLNELLFSAGLAYWDWFVDYHNMKVYEDALQLARQRFDAVKQSAMLGDIPYIDTLEAGIQVQNRILNLEEAKLQYKNAKAFLSIYLWNNGLIPLELNENIVPSPKEELKLPEVKLNKVYDSILNVHPELRRTRFQMDQLKIDEKWSKEQMKPKLNLKYQPIAEAFDQSPLAEYSVNNYTWGLQFEFPIFLRKERGKLDMIQLKWKANQLKLKNKLETQRFKAQSALNELETTRTQINLYIKTTEDYSGLLNGERRLFNNGESSLFLVNSRELGFINAQIKLIELLAKNQKSILKLNLALGSLNRII